MRSKRTTRAILQRLETIKTWQLLVLLVMVGFVAATFLRLNNIGMIERRSAVYAAEKANDDQALGQRLYDLQRYVTSHMNADPGRIALEAKYQRAYDAALKAFEARTASQSSNDVVKKVRAHCDAQAAQGGWGRFGTTADPRYVDCINKEWEKYPTANTETQFVPPSTASYYQTFVSPIWSPDFAGWSLLVAMVLALIILWRIVLAVILRLILRYQFRRI